MKVLIAHPSAQVRRRTGALFAQLGWDALEASNADQALALCDEHRPDVALLDARLTRPGSAAPLVDEVRDVHGTRVVLVQDRLDPEAVLAGVEADEYLLGSVSPAEAAVRVRTAARVKELETQLATRTALPTRAALTGHLRAQISSARRHGRGLALLLVQVDEDADDAVGVALMERLRDEDVVGRWDDDRFAVVLPDADRVGAASVADALRSACGSSARIGGAVWAGENASALVARADDALDRVRAGRVRLDAPSASAVRRPIAGEGISVVLIDDSPEIRQLLAAHLEDTGIGVVGEASGGEDALELVGQLRPDVVVMDMHPRGGDGLTAIRELTARHPAVVIIGFTATDDPDVVRAMREAGAVQYFHRDDLRELVAYLDGDVLAAAVQERRARQRSL